MYSSIWAYKSGMIYLQANFVVHNWQKFSLHLLLFQFLINGEGSPVHQPNADFELSQTSLLPASPSTIKTEATLAPLACNVKQEKIPMQSCGIKSIQPMPVVTAVPVSIQKAQIGQHASTKPAGGTYKIYGIICSTKLDFLKAFLLKWQNCHEEPITGQLSAFFTRFRYVKNLLNPLNPKIWLSILPSSYYTFPCKLVMRIWC